MSMSLEIRRSVLATLAALVLGAGYAGPTAAQRTAAIRLPAELAEAGTMLALSGIGGRNRGDFTASGYSGEFTRTESRLGIFDPLYVANRATSSFSLATADGAPLLTASCRGTRDRATVKAAYLDLKRMAYVCDLASDGGANAGQIVLGEPKREGMKERLLAKDRRRGEATVLGRAFTIESVHEYDRSRLDTQAPLGYLIRHDDREVAAVDLLDWNPRVHLSDAADAELRQAAFAVALALALFRDPAVSALED